MYVNVFILGVTPPKIKGYNHTHVNIDPWLTTFLPRLDNSFTSLSTHRGRQRLRYTVSTQGNRLSLSDKPERMVIIWLVLVKASNLWKILGAVEASHWKKSLQSSYPIIKKIWSNAKLEPTKFRVIPISSKRVPKMVPTSGSSKELWDSPGETWGVRDRTAPQTLLHLATCWSGVDHHYIPSGDLTVRHGIDGP
jgi:hypothetical protein